MDSVTATILKYRWSLKQESDYENNENEVKIKLVGKYSTKFDTSTAPNT